MTVDLEEQKERLKVILAEALPYEHVVFIDVCGCGCNTEAVQIQCPAARAEGPPWSINRIIYRGFMMLQPDDLACWSCWVKGWPRSTDECEGTGACAL